MLRTVEQLTAANFDAALALVAAADDIRGYGPVKEKAMADYRKRCDVLTTRMTEAAAPAVRIQVVEVGQ